MRVCVFWSFTVWCLAADFFLSCLRFIVLSEYTDWCLWSSMKNPLLLSLQILPLPPFPWLLSPTTQISYMVELLTESLLTSLFVFSSVQFIYSLMSYSLRPHELQHARPPCPSPTPGVHSDSRPSSQWCHPAISSSVAPFSCCPQSLPASKSFPMSQLFSLGGQSTGASALKHLFFCAQSFLWSISHTSTWLLEKPCWQSNVSAF